MSAKEAASFGVTLCFDYAQEYNYVLCDRFNLLFIVTPIVGVCNCSMLCYTLLYVHSSVAIILMGKRELVSLLSFSSS